MSQKETLEHAVMLLEGVHPRSLGRQVDRAIEMIKECTRSPDAGTSIEAWHRLALAEYGRGPVSSPRFLFESWRQDLDRVTVSQCLLLQAAIEVKITRNIQAAHSALRDAWETLGPMEHMNKLHGDIANMFARLYAEHYQELSIDIIPALYQALSWIETAVARFQRELSSPLRDHALASASSRRFAICAKLAEEYCVIAEDNLSCVQDESIKKRHFLWKYQFHRKSFLERVRALAHFIGK